MTFADLLGEIEKQSGDGIRSQALTWLNYVRAEVADLHNWQQTLDVEKTLVTTANSTTGVFALDATVDQIVSSEMFDVTNNCVIQHDSLLEINIVDPDRSVSSKASAWAGAGTDSSGNRKIRLYPIPDAVNTIRFHASIRLTEILATDENLSVDPYFGPVLEWGACFLNGMRWYQDLDNNEDPTQTEIQRRRFLGIVVDRKKRSNTAAQRTYRLNNVNTIRPLVFGRLPPAHFRNG